MKSKHRGQQLKVMFSLIFIAVYIERHRGHIAHKNPLEYE